MSVDAIAAHQVVRPTTLVYVVVRVLKLTILTRLIETPVARVTGTVLPHHGTLAMTEASNPLSRVCSTRRISVFGLVHDKFINLAILNYSILLYGLLILFLGEVLGWLFNLFLSLLG